MGGFGAVLSSLGGGGGGLSASSSAGSGDSATGDFNVGAMTFGRSNNDNTGLFIAIAVVAAALIIKR